MARDYTDKNHFFQRITKSYVVFPGKGLKIKRLKAWHSSFYNFVGFKVINKMLTQETL